MNVRRALLGWAGCGALLAGVGCSTLPPPEPESGIGAYWQGRLALRVDSVPPQSFFADFELAGTAQRGRLTLSGPLGQTLGRLSWQPDGARWDDGGARAQQFPSLSELVLAVTGVDVPVRAMFDWLQGEQDASAAGAGWQADLTRLSEGRLVARRLHPEPMIELRLAIER